MLPHITDISHPLLLWLYTIKDTLEYFNINYYKFLSDRSAGIPSRIQGCVCVHVCV